MVDATGVKLFYNDRGWIWHTELRSFLDLMKNNPDMKEDDPRVLELLHPMEYEDVKKEDWANLLETLNSEKEKNDD